MFWKNVFQSAIAQGTIWVIVIVLILVVLAVLKTGEGAIRVISQIHLPNVRRPRMPEVAWKKVAMPVWTVTKWTLAIGGLVVIGVVMPLYLSYRLSVLASVADPIAYVAAGAFISTFVVSMGGLYLLVKKRSVIREMGLHAMLLYVVAISWLAMIIAGLPLAFLSD